MRTSAETPPPPNANGTRTLCEPAGAEATARGRRTRRSENAAGGPPPPGGRLLPAIDPD